MARERHDQLAKGIFTDWLELFCDVEPEKPVGAEAAFVDVVAYRRRPVPRWRETLGLLVRMTRDCAAFEVFRNPPSARELRACAAKGIDLEAELLRRARRKRQTPGRVSAPMMWIITPTLSVRLRRGFGLEAMPGWPEGFLAPSDGWGMAVVVVHELPNSTETLFLRLMGRGVVQTQAFAAVGALTESHPVRLPTLERMVVFLNQAQAAGRASLFEQELIMKIESEFQKWERVRVERGQALGKAEGVITVLETRGITVSAALRKKVFACSRPAQLDRLLRRAVTVASARELFPRPRASAHRHA